MNWKLLHFLVLFVLHLSCNERTIPITSSSQKTIDTALVIPDKTVEKSKLFYDRKKSLWTFNNQLYNGYAVTFYQENIPKEKIGILNGKKQNQAIEWYPDGQLKRISSYHKGKLHGDKKAYTSDSLHTLVSHLKYVSGKPHGEQKKWYPTGELFKLLNLNMGKEEGLQQAFRKNGALFANYEAREGRIFGLKKAALCFGLEDQNIQYE